MIAIGGILGVMYSVPLRRALVTGTDLPYPEGVAAAEVLKVGAGVGGAEENRRGLRHDRLELARLGRCSTRSRRRSSLAAEAAKTFSVGSGATAVSTSLSMLLIGVGHLVGLTVGIAMFVGLLISWAFLVPHYTSLAGAMPAGTGLDDFVSDRLRQQGAFRRRRHDRRRRDLDPAQDHRPDHLAAFARRSPPTASARPGAAKRSRSPNATFRSASSTAYDPPAR